MNHRNCAFKGDMFFLSNFYPSLFTFCFNDENKTQISAICKSGEHAYQAMKAKHFSDAVNVLKCSSPDEAKKMGRIIKLKDNWEKIKIQVMYDIVFQKFEQNEELKNKLINTGKMELVEENDWHDTFWGVDINTKKGQNHLGKILMEIRDRF